ncbi:MAG: serine acetyltransferase [Solirubrobacteraceae bacterium]
MLSRFASLFEPRKNYGDGLFELIISDYVAYYRATPMRTRWSVSGSTRHESKRRLALMFIPRMLHNPCLHATLLLRLALRSPKFMMGFWRTALIAKHTIDIQGGIEIGPGLLLPHPLGIVLGWQARIGRDVTILHSVTIGGVVRHPEGEPQLCPAIGDDVVIYPQSILVGPITVGSGAVIGAGAWLDHDLPPGAKHSGRSALFQESRLAGADGRSAT